MSKKFCPHCGSQKISADPREAWVEIGEYDETFYEEEGDVVKLTCGDCGKEFFIWKDDVKEVSS